MSYKKVIRFLLKFVLRLVTKLLDKNKDGKVSLDEIETFIKNQISWITSKDIDKYL